jgi:hypothetical protein
MRKSVELDQILENAIAEALGLERPHPFAHRKLRATGKSPNRRHHGGRASHREQDRAAA